MGHRNYYVYMMSNARRTVLYTGMTNALERRVWEHKTRTLTGFTQKYFCDRLVFLEEYTEVEQAIAREKQIKGWRRDHKNALIATTNPEWADLAADWYDQDPSPSSRLRMTQCSERHREPQIE